VNLYGCEIGHDTVEDAFVQIGKRVEICRNCKTNALSFISEGVTIEDESFVAPHVRFTNVRFLLQSVLERF